MLLLLLILSFFLIINLVINIVLLLFLIFFFFFILISLVVILPINHLLLVLSKELLLAVRIRLFDFLDLVGTVIFIIVWVNGYLFFMVVFFLLDLIFVFCGRFLKSGTGFLLLISSLHSLRTG